MTEKSSLPPDMWGTLMAAAWAILWALSGRLLYVSNLVRLGKRKRFWTFQTIWELGVAIGMGIVAGGLADHLNLSGLTEAGFIATSSYLGPHAIEVGLEWLAQKFGVPTTVAEPKPPAEPPTEEPL